jgi:prepilin-type N-terminal cleavage/methylation domain-containing protein
MSMLRNHPSSRGERGFTRRAERGFTRRAERGFTLVEMIVVTLLLLIAMLGLLAVFDASARINKSETDVADAQGAVRYGIYQMTSTIRMAGAGGLFLTQAVVNEKPSGATGITVAGGNSYNNVAAGTKITDSVTGLDILVRPGTDMIQIRGVIKSPLLAFDHQSGCSAGCVTAGETILVLPVAGDTTIGQVVNDDVAQRPQFAAIDAYTSSITGATNGMFVIMADGVTDLHVGCSSPDPGGTQRFPQPAYNVGKLVAATNLSAPGGPPLDARVFSAAADFTDLQAERINSELPSDGPLAPTPIQTAHRVGVLDDIIYFVAMLPVAQDPQGLHPYLAQGIRRGDKFEVTPLADDVEDLQIAYGIDTTDLAGTGLPDNAITRQGGPNPPYDSDTNSSNVQNKDEWRPNVAGETVPIPADFQSATPPLGNHTGVPPAAHCPRLHAVMISLLAKAHDPDPTYKGPAASGYVLMDVPLSSGVPVTAVAGRYRRRVQTLRINLRNYAFQG